ncbi:MAG: efflux RND transporter periplasmic adaptor subunit [Asticcacaulis sp.]|uniref:efflux RND transporter periplasmic adaptor subunit n=1 Tax=Asticcacaulis sp. TaxID=1872648 RepID=UPI003F7C0CE6
MTTTRQVSLWAVIAILSLTGCSSKSASDSADAPPVALVQLATAQKGPIQETVPLYGTVAPSPEGSVTLSATAESVVRQVKVTVGSKVSVGQVLAILEPSPTTQQATAKALADAAAAKSALARSERLRADNLVSDADVETARATAKAAIAAAQAAEAQMKSLIVTSPEAGFVSVMNAKSGDLLAAGAPIATVVSANALNGDFGLDPSLASRVRVGDRVRIHTDSGDAFDAHVLSVSPVVDQQTRLAPVITDLPANAAIGAGQPLRADLALSSQSSALIIPYAAILDDGGQPYVYVVKAGLAHRVDVTTGPQSGDSIAILKGLQVGDRVVVQGGTALDDGMKVRLK